jgi:hypothetical protein
VPTVHRAAPLPDIYRIEPAVADPAEPAQGAQPLTRRAARAAETAATKPAPAQASALAGSILSPETWRRTAAALKREK